MKPLKQIVDEYLADWDARPIDQIQKPDDPERILEDLQFLAIDRQEAIKRLNRWYAYAYSDDRDDESA